VGCDSIATLNLTISSVTATATLNSADNTISASQGGSYQWVICPSYTPISGATSQIYAPTANGSYAVIVTTNNCSDTSDCVDISNLGIDEMEISFNVTIMPNPSNGLFNVIIDEKFSGNLIITDGTGRVVCKEILNGSKEVDLSHVASGVYYFYLSTQNSSKVVRVIKN
jgi:hypothetical protein